MRHRLLSGILVVALSASVSAQQPPAPGGLSAAASQEFAPSPPYRDQVAQRGPVVTMGVEEVIRRAMTNNLDVLIEGFNVALSEQRLVAARGAYDPSLSLSSVAGSTANPLTAAAGAIAIPSERVDTAAGASTLRQTLPGGTSASVAISGQRTATTNPASLLTPSFASTLTGSVTQPLLRGFIRTAAARQIALSDDDIAIARAQYRLRVTQVLQQVLNQYWELVFAVESYEARRQSKAVALLQYQSTVVRVQNGLLAPVALTASQAEIASRERDLLQAEVQIITAENGLKQLLAEDATSPVWGSAILPGDSPATELPALPLAAVQAMARERRSELAQLRLQIDQNRVDRSFFSLETKPTVNLAATFSATGRVGTVLQRTADGRVTDPSNPGFGRLDGALRQLWSLDFPAWTLGLTVQVPIRNRAAESQLLQVRIAGDRLSTQLAKLTQSVSVEAQNAWQVIAVQRKSLEAARLTTQLFEQQLDAQQARYDAGFSSDFELLRYQRDAVDARVRELRARVDLQEAIIALQRATDTLVDDLKVTLPYGKTP